MDGHSEGAGDCWGSACGMDLGRVLLRDGVRSRGLLVDITLSESLQEGSRGIVGAAHD